MFIQNIIATIPPREWDFLEWDFQLTNLLYLISIDTIFISHKIKLNYAQN